MIHDTTETREAEEGVSRRQAIARLMALLAGIALPGSAHQHTASIATPLPSALPARTFFTSEEKATVAALAELIIPPDSVAPGAKAAKVEDYIDLVVATSPPEIQSQWTEGLRALEQLCRERAGGTFLSLSPTQQEAVLGEIARGEGAPANAAERFFVRVKHATADGFYTSRIGLLDDLKYQGNSYVEGPATCKEKLAGPGESIECKRRPPTRRAT